MYSIAFRTMYEVCSERFNIILRIVASLIIIVVLLFFVEVSNWTKVIFSLGHVFDESFS